MSLFKGDTCHYLRVTHVIVLGSYTERGKRKRLLKNWVDLTK